MGNLWLRLTSHSPFHLFKNSQEQCCHFFLLLINQYVHKLWNITVLHCQYLGIKGDLLCTPPSLNYIKNSNLTDLVWFWLSFMVFNATFNNISVISWQSVLLVEETGENHRPVISNWQTLSHNVVLLTPSGIQTHNMSDDRHRLHR